MLLTARLVLRDWTEADRAPFAAMSGDPEVMRYLTALPDRAASDAWIDRQRGRIAAQGFGFWAVAERDGGAFVGSVGLLQVPYEAHFTPAVEIGWRVARGFWRRGYALEAARASLAFGFGELGLGEIVANAVMGNAASRAVMARLGMVHDPADDFDHPRLPEGNPLRRHVLYRIDASAALES